MNVRLHIIGMAILIPKFLRFLSELYTLFKKYFLCVKGIIVDIGNYTPNFVLCLFYNNRVVDGSY